MSELKQPLSNVQIEILKSFSANLSDTNLLKLRKTLANFFYELAVEEADEVWDKEGWDEEKVDSLLNTKLRAKQK